MRGDLRAAYEARVASGLARDAAQADLVERMQRLLTELDAAPGVLDRLRGRRIPPRGLYIWGEIGRGKSMLVDLLMEASDSSRSRRIHFHAFMQDLHRALHHARKTGADRPVEAATDALTRNIALLALDELEITDIADAAIVGRVFERIFARGVAVVVTSNRRPRDLSRALKTELFRPFVRLVEDRMEVVHLDGATDYRRAAPAGAESGSYLLRDRQESRAFDARWARLPGDEDAPRLMEGAVQLRRKAHVLRGEFEALCRVPLSARYYLEMLRDARGLFLEGVPVLGPQDEDAARRFIILIDALYDIRGGLVVSAAAPPDLLYQGEEHRTEFPRTESRLHEMCRGNWPGAAAFK